MCGKTPEAPDLSETAEASRYQADLNFKYQMEQLDWAREQFDKTEGVLEQILGPQLAMQLEQWEFGKTDRERYQKVFQGQEDKLVAEADSYASPERIALERGRAMGAVQQTFDAQRENAQRNLESYGIDPSQTRAGAMDRNARVQMAMAQAGAANNAQQQTEAMGRALRSEAINVGRGMPGQIASSYGLALQAGSSALNNQMGSVQSGASTMGTAQGWGQMGMQGLQQSANIHTMNFQNQQAAYNQAAQNSWGAAVGDIVGTGLGVATAFGVQEGGSIPEDMSPVPGPRDTVPAALEVGEYVIPKDVVEWKGKEFFERLTAKAREDSRGDGKAPDQRGIPA
jgi:hypothetical protein